MPIPDTQLSPLRIEARETHLIEPYAHHPAEAPPNNAVQLVEALSKFSPTLRALALQWGARQQTAGKAAALTAQHVKDYQDAVDKGQMRPGESMLFKRAYNEQVATNNALEAAHGWQTQYLQWEGKNADDPAAFDQWMAQRIHEATAGVADPRQMAAMEPVLDAGIKRMYAMHSEYTTNRLEQSYKDEVGRSVDNVISIGLDNALKSGKPFDADNAWTQIERLKNTSRALRALPPAEVNKMVVDSIISNAHYRAAQGDPNYQEVLKLGAQDWTDQTTGQRIPGPGKAGELADRLRTASTEADHTFITQAEERVRLEKEQRKQAQDQWLASNLGTLVANRGRATPQQMAQGVQAFGMEGFKELMDVSSKIGSNAERMDGRDIAPLFGHLINGPGDPYHNLMDVLPHANQAVAESLVNYYTKLAHIGDGDPAKGVSVVRGTPEFAGYAHNLDRAVAGDPMFAKVFGQNSEGIAQAESLYFTGAAEFIKNNPQATSADKLKFADQLWTTITKAAATQNQQREAAVAKPTNDPAAAAAPQAPSLLDIMQKPATAPATPKPPQAPTAPPAGKSPSAAGSAPPPWEAPATAPDPSTP